jgi:hypothetical protein
MSEAHYLTRLGPAAKMPLYVSLCAIIAFPLLRIATGFYHFLAANLPRISANADTLIPGIAAFVIATHAAHRMIAGYYRKRGIIWPFSNTCCLAALLPVLFIIAFLVPGVILNLQLLVVEM